MQQWLVECFFLLLLFRSGRASPDEFQLFFLKDRTFKCHKFILASRSKWFHNALLSGMRESRER